MYSPKLIFATLLLGFISANRIPYSIEKHVFKTFESDVSVDYDKDWWKTAAIYQIYPRSFKDSDNDGNGDLQGIIQKLDHIKNMSVDGIWLSPIYKSPQVDNGYDVSDYRDIDPMYGTLDDLRQLIDEAHKLNIKVIMDYVPNHTSDQHKWFQASLEQDQKYDEYYIWRNATYVDGEKKPPNNWLSGFGGSAWEWNENRQQYYYHLFTTGQPDLNYRNPAVVEEMKDVLRYWLNFGVDGFRLDAVEALCEDVSFSDEPESGECNPEEYCYLKHIYTVDTPDTIDMVYQWREVLDNFTEQNNTYTRMMVAEAGHEMLFLGTPDGSRLGAHYIFNVITFIDTTQRGFTAMDLTMGIKKWFDNLPEIYTSNWVLGNHDQRRVATRLGVENIDALNILTSILPGGKFTYNGEEIGQEDGEVTCEQGYDPEAIKNCSTFNTTSRDFERTPFQWNNFTNAGFNKGAKPWLPVSEKYIATNLADQDVSDVDTHYTIFKEVLKLRQGFRNTSSDQLLYGTMSENIFYAERTTDNEYYFFYYNIGDTEKLISNAVGTESFLKVSVASTNSEYKVGDTFDPNQPLKPREAVLGKVTG